MSSKFSDDLDYNESRCSFCGKHDYTGSWRGAVKLILACRECALEVLPALFADATYHPAWRPHSGDQELNRLAAAYWKAQAINLSKKRG
ncbi:MAG TPA: hypothetical protein VN723_05745 [Rhizomicrobium sp.]|nr:hypothetical protein [Rhizomicrobium sp.]